MGNLRTLVWAYLWLLIFEGAIRKWIAPALDAPLLVIRDPLVVWIYYEASRNRLSFNNAFFMPNLVLGLITIFTSIVFGFDNVAVLLYGIHVNYLQIPLIFLMPQILNRDDVIVMGRFFLYVTIPMALLVIFQFRSSPDSLVNKGAFLTWYGTVRPSGTFSFIAGLVAFFAMVSSFLFYGYLQARTYALWLVGTVTFLLLLASGVSGSRTCLISIGIVAVVAVLCVVLRGKGGVGLLIAAALIGIAVPILLSTQVGQDGAGQLVKRFKDGANNNEDAKGMANRYGETMLQPLVSAGDAPFFGNGIGIGTNAAAGLLKGKREFIGPEDEWGRLIFECGPVFGLLLILFRVALTLTVGKCAFDAMRRDNILPMLIFGGCGVSILNGQWGVPTSLGFAIFGAGLTLAACVEPEEEEEDDDERGEDDEDHDDHAEDESDQSPATDRVA
jgi:hypothetical protein